MKEKKKDQSQSAGASSSKRIGKSSANGKSTSGKSSGKKSGGGGILSCVFNLPGKSVASGQQREHKDIREMMPTKKSLMEQQQQKNSAAATLGDEERAGGEHCDAESSKTTSALVGAAGGGDNVEDTLTASVSRGAVDTEMTSVATTANAAVAGDVEMKPTNAQQEESSLGSAAQAGSGSVLEMDSDYEPIPESQLFDNMSSEYENSQEALIGRAIGKKKGEDLDTKYFENCLFVVFDLSREQLGTVVILKSFDDDNVPLHFRLTLRGMWIRTPIDHGDLVRVIGRFNKQNQYTLVLDDQCEADEDDSTEQQAQFLILEPFVMISSTSIVSSFPCVRRSLFSDSFRSSATEFGYALVIGNIIHDAFERILQAQNFDNSYLDTVFKQAMMPHFTYIYQLKMTEDRVLSDLRQAANNIQEWVSSMLDSEKNNYGIAYDRTIATEQEFNSNTYGIKGKIDATVVLKNAHQPDIQRVTALELKTGREQNSHRGQVLLYSLLLTERFNSSNNQNLLLYLMKEPKTYYIKTVRNEICLLIQRRNELAKLQKIGGEGKNYTLPPILDQEVCKTCWVNRLCSFYQMSMEQPLPKEPQFKAYQEVKEIAAPESLMYFSRWLDIINLEQSTVNLVGKSGTELNIGDTKRAVKEEGMRITDLQTSEEDGGSDEDQALATFDLKLERPFYVQGAKKSGDITAGCYVNLHTQNSISFTKGLVLKKHLITKKRQIVKSQNADGEDEENDEDQDDDEDAETDQTMSISGATSSSKSRNTPLKKRRNTRKNVYLQYIIQFQHVNRLNFSLDSLGGLDYKEVEWSLEQETFQTYQFNIMRNNLQNLCTSVNKHHNLRHQLIMNKKPSWAPPEDQTVFEEQHLEILEGLNEEQRKAVVRSFTAEDFQMIIGVPGSGKVQTIIRFLRIAKKLKFKVILFGVNHTAIDSLLLSLLAHEEERQVPTEERINFVKVISQNQKLQTHPKLVRYADSCSSFESLRSLVLKIQDTDLVVTSVNNVFNQFFGCFEFDYCLINEASLIVEPLAIGPLLFAKKFIMLGDYYQLNPMVKSAEAEKRGMSISLFRRLCEQHPYNVVILRKQYRMNDHIANLSNTIAYKGLIRHASQEVSEQKLNLYNEKGIGVGVGQVSHFGVPWLKELRNPDRKVIFVNIDNLLNKTLQKQLNAMKNRNYFESAIIGAIVEHFVERQPDADVTSFIQPKQMAIVTPFLDQQVLLQKQLAKHCVRVFHIDKIQSLSKDLIIVSCVKHNRKCINLKDIRRLYTAFTHASKKLILVGSMLNLKEVEPLDQFIGYIKKKNWYIDINNALQIKKYFPSEAAKCLTFLQGDKAGNPMRHPNTMAYLGNNRQFADENQILYHIDGVPTTHTGAIKSKLN